MQVTMNSMFAITSTVICFTQSYIQTRRPMGTQLCSVSRDEKKKAIS